MKKEISVWKVIHPWVVPAPGRPSVTFATDPAVGSMHDRIENPIGRTVFAVLGGASGYCTTAKHTYPRMSNSTVGQQSVRVYVRPSTHFRPRAEYEHKGGRDPASQPARTTSNTARWESLSARRADHSRSRCHGPDAALESTFRRGRATRRPVFDIRARNAVVRVGLGGVARRCGAELPGHHIGNLSESEPVHRRVHSAAERRAADG
jgi:hypothetical protein